MERLQLFIRLAPHTHVVHGQDLVEQLRECRKMLGRTETKHDAPRTRGLRVVSRRLPHHDGRVIDTAHKAVRRPTAQLSDGDPRTAADFEDAVGGLQPEQADCPTLRWRFDDRSAISHPAS